MGRHPRRSQELKILVQKSS